MISKDQPIRFKRVPEPDSSRIRRIRNLIDSCNRFTGASYSWDSGQEFRKNGDANTFLVESGGRTVGWLQIFAPRRSEGEITLLIHPEYRNSPVYSGLLDAGRLELVRRGIPSLLLVCDAADAFSCETAEFTGAQYEYSEYLMRFRRTGTADAGTGRTGDAALVSVEPAGQDDRDVLAAIYSEAFPDDTSDPEDIVDEFFLSPRRSLFRIDSAGIPVGMIGVYEAESCAYIHGFAVSAEYRGRGIGRQALSILVRRIKGDEPDKPIELEVQTGNTRALGLYESAGFARTAEFRYFRNDVEKPVGFRDFQGQTGERNT